MSCELIDFDELSHRMDNSISAFKSEIAALRTGRASAHLLDPIMVEAYGSQMPINQLGTVNVPEARLISVQVWDKACVTAVEKAIRESNLGLNPATDGQLIRVPLPELNAERRAELVKVAHKYAENARISVRHVRRDGMENIQKMQKKSEISEDEHRTMSEKIQTLTDNHIQKIDQLLSQKEDEITKV